MITKEVSELSTGRIFEEDLSFGELGVNLFIESEAWKLLYPDTKKPEKIIDSQGQHFQGDLTIAGNFFEVKTRTPRYSDFCGEDIVIELSNTAEPNSDQVLFAAWLSKYSNETKLIYQWTRLDNLQVKLMRPIVIFKPSDLRNYSSWLQRHKIKSSWNKRGYFTNFVTVKLERLKEKIPVQIITWDKII